MVIERLEPLDTRKVSDLIAAGFHQVSRRHGLLAKIPEGMTGREALQSAESGRVVSRELREADAASQYRRCYARKPDRIRVTQSKMTLFRKSGGPVS
jgi:hypothetical protein